MQNGESGEKAAEPVRKPKLTRLKIDSFRNVASCELRFGDRFNVLLGLNATGKTTLLELLAAALSFDFSKLGEEEFGIEYDLAFSLGTILVSVRNERQEAEPLPLLTRLSQLDETETFALKAKLQFCLTSPSKAWTVRADTSLNSIWIEEKPERKLLLQKPLGKKGTGLLSRALRLVSDGMLGLEHLIELNYWAKTRRFDEALDLFREITGPSTWLEISVSAGISDSGVWVLHPHGVVPEQVQSASADELMAMQSHNEQGLTIDSDSINFLQNVKNLFGFNNARFEMRLESKDTKYGESIEVLKYGDFRFMFEDRAGSIIRHHDLSYGQKRLLAFHYYLAANPMTVIADELVDGLHHQWIDAAIEAIGDRQAFLASQNPLLLDHLEFSSAEEVASTFVTCRAEQTDDGTRLYWSNMSPYDAERFFRAYQVDVKHVSEILLSKGLW